MDAAARRLREEMDTALRHLREQVWTRPTSGHQDHRPNRSGGHRRLGDTGDATAPQE